MKSLITKILISLFILFIVFSFLILNSNKDNINTIEEEKEVEKHKTYLVIYDFIVLVFLIVLITYVSYNGYVKGCIKSLFIWAFFVLCTPIPEAGLIITLPLKRYLNIPMYISQTIVSFCALVILSYFYIHEKNIIKSYKIGKIFIELITLKYFSIIILSVLSSILTSGLIDNFINHYIYKHKLNYLYTKIYIIVLCVMIYIYLLNSLLNKIKN